MPVTPELTIELRWVTLINLIEQVGVAIGSVEWLNPKNGRWESLKLVRITADGAEDLDG
jgi:hypothetical protein